MLNNCKVIDSIRIVEIAQLYGKYTAVIGIIIVVIYSSTIPAP